MKSDRKTLLSGKPKWEEGRKAAPQPHPVHLCEVGQRESASSRVEKVNSVRSCPLSIKILCHNMQWNFGYLFGHFFALKLLHVWLWMQPENGWKQIWNKYERNPTEKYSWVKIPNWWRNFPKLVVDRKAALQPHPVNLREFFRWQMIALVLTISILCLGDHFQWKKFSQSAREVQFPGYRPFVLPTHNQVSWGTWLAWTPLNSLSAVAHL